jgi:hypothetical protein
MTPNDRPGYGGLTVLLAFLGGAAVGAAAALLLAPRSGAETRRRLAGKTGEAGEALSRGARVAREAALAAQSAFKAALAGSDEPQPGPRAVVRPGSVEEPKETAGGPAGSSAPRRAQHRRAQ